jgi:acyl-CoA hydrolase
MAWTDMCGGICAMRHAGGLAVTAAIDELVFERPLAVGDMVVLEARVNAAFRSSLEVEVCVWGEAPATGERWKCVTALFTFVGVDERGALRPVPGLLPETDSDRDRAREAALRRAERLSRRRAVGA